MGLMKVDKEGLTHLKKLEGFRNNVYLDSANVPTIGYGFTYYPDGTRVTMQDNPITRKEAEKMLLEIVEPFEEVINNSVTKPLTQNQFNALVSFAYNVGQQAFKTSTLLKRINEDPNHKDIEAQFKRWKFAGGKVVNGLKKRRNQEFYLYNL